MSDILLMIIAFITGIALGLVFFGGLWLTVKKSIYSKTPGLWFFLSFLLRVAIVLLGFYFVSSGDWRRLLICTFGFIIGRFIVSRVTKPAEKDVMIDKQA